MTKAKPKPQNIRITTPVLQRRSVGKMKKRKPMAMGTGSRSQQSSDLSSFYHWIVDLLPVVMAKSFSDGYKNREIQSITAVCPNLEQYVGYEALQAIASKCPSFR